MWPWKIIKRKKTPLARVVEILRAQNIDLVFDVGANTGQYAAQLREYGYKGRIVSFEPTSQAHKTLLKRAADDPGWDVAPPMALGREKAEIAINVAQASDMSSFMDPAAMTLEALPDTQVAATETVRVEALDDIYNAWAGSARHPFLKIDTQGYEGPVLQGAAASLDKMRGVQLELSFVPLYEGEPTFEEITLWLREKGFAPWLSISGYFSRRLGRQLQLDLVFINEKTS